MNLLTNLSLLSCDRCKENYDSNHMRSFIEINTADQPAPDRRASSSNPEKNRCFYTAVRPVISYYCHVKSVYMNTQLD